MTTILVVDDYPVNREYLSALLRYKGYETREASDGAEALVLARSLRPDLILTDILMPTMDGYEFVHRLRADPLIAATGVVFCTANYIEREAQILSRACGVAQLLIKPCDPEQVLATVEAALGNRGQPSSSGALNFEREHLRLLTDKLSRQTLTLDDVHRRLTALIQTSAKLAEESDVSRLLARVCRAARELVGASISSLAIGTESSVQATAFFTSGLDPTAVDRIGMPDFHESLMGDVFASGRPYRDTVNREVPSCDGLPPGFPSARCLLAVPINSLTRSYGWLCLIDKVSGEPFTPEDQQLVTILAAQAGRTYETMELLARAQRDAADLAGEANERRLAQEHMQVQIERLNLLHNITRAVAERQDLPSIFQVVIRSLEQDLPIDFGCLALYDASQQNLTASAIGTKDAALANTLRQPGSTTLELKADALHRCIDGELLYDPDLPASDAPLARTLAQARYNSLVVSPLRVDRKVIGALIVARRPRAAFSDEECDFLLQLSDHVALAAHHAQLHLTLQHAYDELRDSQKPEYIDPPLSTPSSPHELQQAIVPLTTHRPVSLKA